MPVSAIVHEESAAAKPSKKPGANVRRKPLTPTVKIANSATRAKARRLWAKIASPSSSVLVWLADLTRLDSDGTGQPA